MAAIKELERVPVFVGPALDGGFGLIGVTKFSNLFFKDLPWGYPGVTEKLLTNIQLCGLNYGVGTTLWDVDTAEDYKRYKAWLDEF